MLGTFAYLPQQSGYNNPARMRPLPRDDQTLGTGRVDRLRLLLVARTVLPGPARLHLVCTLALAAAIWHNRATGQPITRSLIAYDH